MAIDQDSKGLYKITAEIILVYTAGVPNTQLRQIAGGNDLTIERR